MTDFATRAASAMPDAIAPDGSEVRVLCGVAQASMALFTLAPGTVARAVVHATVAELWYVVAGEGRLWRRLDTQEAVVDLRAGVSVSIPLGTAFQFRSDGAEALVVLGVTMPPWPGAEEAAAVPGVWDASV